MDPACFLHGVHAAAAAKLAADIEDMSRWFAQWLKNQDYLSLITEQECARLAEAFSAGIRYGWEHQG